MKIKHRKIALHTPGKGATVILRIGLPLVLLSSVTLLISYLSARRQDAAYANFVYPQMLEYIFASLAILCGGAVLADVTEEQRKSR